MKQWTLPREVLICPNGCESMSANHKLVKKCSECGRKMRYYKFPENAD